MTKYLPMDHKHYEACLPSGYRAPYKRFLLFRVHTARIRLKALYEAARGLYGDFKYLVKETFS